MESTSTRFPSKLNIELNLDPDFVQSIHSLIYAFGEPFEKLNGFHNSNLNFSDFIDHFVDSRDVVGSTIDPTSNNSAYDICTLESDMVKPHKKLLAFNKIFYEHKKKYGLAQANKWLLDEWTGASYCHNSSSSSYKSYCFAYDLDKLVEKGLFFIDTFKTAPCQHLTTFNDHVLEYVGWLCNRTSGAVGLVSYLVYSWYFWNKDVKAEFYLKNPEYYRRQCFQKFIFDLSQPYLRITEKAFTNISIMDRCYLTELFGGREFPDGSFAIDHIDEILEHQKVFMEVLADIRSHMMVTFPVITYSLLYQNGKFVDEETAKWANKHNMQWYDGNFYVGSDVTSLSNCCFDAEQMMTIKVGDNIYTGPFKRLYQTYHHRKDVQVFYEGKWLNATLTALEEKHPIFEINTVGGRTMRATEDHIHLTDKGELKSHELKVGDNLLGNTSPGVEKIEFLSSGKDMISSIERVEQNGDWVFCVELEDKENPYFTLANGIQTHNCRLVSDTTKINAFINSIGGTSLSIGSVQVNTINLRRIALESAGDQDKYMEILNERLDTCIKALDVIRGIISRNVEKGLLPNYSYELIELAKQYNTVGITAMYEVMEDFNYIDTDEFGNKSYSAEGMAFATRIMNHINTQKDGYGFDYSINVECIPAERANIVLCKKDALMYTNIKKYPLYSNQWIPLTSKCTLAEKIRLGAILDKECGGG